MFLGSAAAGTADDDDDDDDDMTASTAARTDDDNDMGSQYRCMDKRPHGQTTTMTWTTSYAGTDGDHGDD